MLWFRPPVALSLAALWLGLAGCATENDQWAHHRRHHLVVYEFPRDAIDAHPDDRPELAMNTHATGPRADTQNNPASSIPTASDQIENRKSATSVGVAMNQLHRRSASPTDPDDGPARFKGDLALIDSRLAELEAKVERGPDNAKDNVRGLLRQIRGERSKLGRRIADVEELPRDERQAELVEILTAYLQTNGLLTLVESWYESPGGPPPGAGR